MINHINSSEISLQITSNQRQELASIKARFNLLLQSIMEESKQLNAKFDLSKVWPATEKLPTLYKQLDEFKYCLDSFRPSSPETILDMQESWDIQYTYDSNRIEGNALTLDEMLHVIEKGLSIGGKPFNDHLEAINHQEAIHYIRELADDLQHINNTYVALFGGAINQIIVGIAVAAFTLQSSFIF